MIFDLKDAILILVSVAILAFCFAEYALAWGIPNDDDECDHCFADFQSTGKRHCIDCGYEEDIKKPHYPKHQR